MKALLIVLVLLSLVLLAGIASAYSFQGAQKRFQKNVMNRIHREMYKTMPNRVKLFGEFSPKDFRQIFKSYRKKMSGLKYSHDSCMALKAIL
ncbi:MAG: hypothetical protein ISS36_02780 [Candidatus Aenigmarchaeota archaeon]|nr:hypothetical protein [Candidatus Aenigmarchaeota archaeon]